MKLAVFILTLFMSQEIFAQHYYLLAGTYTKPEKSKGIYLYDFNTDNADAKLVSTVFTENPSFLALSHDNAHVYAVNELENNQGAVSSFAFDKSKGTLTALGTQLTHGDDPCYVAVDATNKWAAVANYTSGSLSVFPIGPDGKLGPAAQTIPHTGKGPNAERQEGPHVHCTIFSPDNKHLAVADLGTDQITAYAFDASSDHPLTEDPTVLNAPPGSGPRHLVFHPTLPVAYLVSELAGTVTLYSYRHGEVDTIQTINSHPADFTGEVASAAIHFSPDGKFLYASNRGTANSISMYSVDPTSGMLTSLGFQSTGGDHPRDFTIDPTGKFLLVGNMKSGNITIFNRDLTTGLLKDSGKKIKIPQPTQLVFTQMK